MADMGCKNRLVIVKEKITTESQAFMDLTEWTPKPEWSCKVLGLDYEERQKFCQLLDDDDDGHLEVREMIEVYDQRASNLIPILEKMDYEYYNVSDNADIVTNDRVRAGTRESPENYQSRLVPGILLPSLDRVVVTWRFLKKL